MRLERAEAKICPGTRIAQVGDINPAPWSYTSGDTPPCRTLPHCPHAAQRSFNAIILDFKRLRQGTVTSAGFARFDLERIARFINVADRNRDTRIHQPGGIVIVSIEARYPFNVTKCKTFGLRVELCRNQVEKPAHCTRPLASILRNIQSIQNGYVALTRADLLYVAGLRECVDDIRHTTGKQIMMELIHQTVVNEVVNGTQPLVSRRSLINEERRNAPCPAILLEIKRVYFMTLRYPQEASGCSAAPYREVNPKR